MNREFAIHTAGRPATLVITPTRIVMTIAPRTYPRRESGPTILTLELANYSGFQAKNRWFGKRQNVMIFGRITTRSLYFEAPAKVATEIRQAVADALAAVPAA